MKTAAACVLFLSATLAHAQGSCESFGSPCGIPWLACAGEVAPGESLVLTAPGTPEQPMLLALGELLVEPALVPFPLACIPPGCDLRVEPSLVLAGEVGGAALGAFELEIPADPGLAGLVVGAQAVSPSPSGTGCFYASPGVKIAIGR